MTEPLSRRRAGVHHPEWSKDAVIYQINQRQLTPEGTLRAAAAHLPRIRDLGVSIIWLMPINPIGKVNRKGTLGSPYAVRDYLEVNPEFGDLAGLRHFVRVAHELGLRVILDWVANHTAWDNVLVREHPEWYARDWKGDFRPTPWWDWDDVIDLDYDQPDLRDFMVEAMCYWVREADVDGFRCDVAGFVPLDFWERARAELEAIKPVFMLAEWETRDLHTSAFDASYAWSWNAALHEIASGRADLEPLRVYYAWNARSWPDDAMRLTFVSNHDMNAWEGTEFEQFGDALDAVVVLSVVGEGIPMIYSGQEAGSDRRLPLFDKDGIDWRPHAMGRLYSTMFGLKRRHPALWNGSWGAPMVRVLNSDSAAVLTFTRTAPDGDSVFAAFNLSAQARAVTLGEGFYGNYQEALGSADQDALPLRSGARLSLDAWGWLVFAT